MKIRLSTSHWIISVFLWTVSLFCSVFFIAFAFCYNDPQSIFSALFTAGFFGGFPFSDWKSLMTARIEDGRFRNYFFGKLRSEVSAEKDIYFATFIQFQARPYIVLSNQPLNIPKERPFQIRMQQLPEQVILPFNAKTAPYLDLENWHFHADIPLHNQKVSQIGRNYRAK